MIERDAPGLTIAMLKSSLDVTPMAMLSRYCTLTNADEFFFLRIIWPSYRVRNAVFLMWLYFVGGLNKPILLVNVSTFVCLGISFCKPLKWSLYILTGKQGLSSQFWLLVCDIGYQVLLDLKVTKVSSLLFQNILSRNVGYCACIVQSRLTKVGLSAEIIALMT